MTEAHRWSPEEQTDIQVVFDELGLTRPEDRALFSLFAGDTPTDLEKRLHIVPSLSDTSSPFYVKE